MKEKNKMKKNPRRKKQKNANVMTKPQSQDEEEPKKKKAEEPQCDDQAPKPNEGTGTSSGGELPDLTPENDGAVPSTSRGTSNQPRVNRYKPSIKLSIFNVFIYPVLPSLIAFLYHKIFAQKITILHYQYF